MNTASHSGNKRLTSIDRTEVLRIVVADAESMGMRNRDKIYYFFSIHRQIIYFLHSGGYCVN